MSHNEKQNKTATPVELAKILEQAGYEVLATGHEEAFTGSPQTYAIRLLVYPEHKTLNAEQQQ